MKDFRVILKSWFSNKYLLFNFAHPWKLVNQHAAKKSAARRAQLGNQYRKQIILWSFCSQHCFLSFISSNQRIALTLQRRYIRRCWTGEESFVIQQSPRKKECTDTSLSCANIRLLSSRINYLFGYNYGRYFIFNGSMKTVIQSRGHSSKMSIRHHNYSILPSVFWLILAFLWSWARERCASFLSHSCNNKCRLLCAEKCILQHASLHRFLPPLVSVLERVMKSIRYMTTYSSFRVQFNISYMPARCKRIQTAQNAFHCNVPFTIPDRINSPLTYN